MRLIMCDYGTSSMATAIGPTTMHQKCFHRGGGGIPLHHQRCGILHVYATVSWPILSSLLLTLFTGATHSEVFTSIPG